MSDPSTIEPVVTQYTVCALPEDHKEFHYFSLTIDRVMGYHGVSGWAVRRMGQCIDRTGVWDYEPQPSSRTDEWIAAHRHDLDTALKLAKAAAPRVTLNGHSIEDVLARG